MSRETLVVSACCARGEVLRERLTILPRGCDGRRRHNVVFIARHVTHLEGFTSSLALDDPRGHGDKSHAARHANQHARDDDLSSQGAHKTHESERGTGLMCVSCVCDRKSEDGGVCVVSFLLFFFGFRQRFFFCQEESIGHGVSFCF